MTTAEKEKSLPTNDEMESAVNTIRTKCRVYRGKNEQVFAGLYQRIGTPPGPDMPPETRAAIIRAQYLDAISTLVNLVDPPNQQTMLRALKKIDDARCPPSDSVPVEAPLKDVQIVEPNGETTYMLSENLSPLRKHSRADRSLLNEFAASLPEPTWWSDDDDVGVQ